MQLNMLQNHGAAAPHRQEVHMPTTRFALIGSGWRSEFFLRIAQALPQRFQMTGILIRDLAKAKAFGDSWGVQAVSDLDALLAAKPEFVVLSVKRGAAFPYLQQLAQRGVPVLCETPPAENTEELGDLWHLAQQGFRLQVAEQYFLQPLYAAWLQAVQEGLIGRVQNISLSALHAYHAVSIIRLFLGVGLQNCSITGRRYGFEVTETSSRAGQRFDGEVSTRHRDRLDFVFDGGGVGFFDFSDVQYHSTIRTRQMNVQGTRGEIDDLCVRYLTPENMPVEAHLRRVDDGVYGNREWAHQGLMLGDRFLYRNPFPGARLNDDEIAIASCLAGMADYVRTGQPFYPLADALQDSYLSLLMAQALHTPYQEVRSEVQGWVDGDTSAS